MVRLGESWRAGWHNGWHTLGSVNRLRDTPLYEKMVAMKAGRVHKPGGPEGLVYGDVPDPQAGAGQVVVKIEAKGDRVHDFVRSADLQRGNEYRRHRIVFGDAVSARHRVRWRELSPQFCRRCGLQRLASQRSVVIALAVSVRAQGRLSWERVPRWERRHRKQCDEAARLRTTCSQTKGEGSWPSGNSST